MVIKIKLPFPIFLLLILFCLPQVKLIAQLSNTTFRGFGHIEYTLKYQDHADSYFSLGEHDLFVTSKINDKFSFLGEYVIRFNSGSSTNYLPSIERSFIKYNYRSNKSILLGKVHTPVNYWNDVYHHGRLFFPTIDRPNIFNFLVPLHTLGLQIQGQNIGEKNFGYDIVIGNGISSSDVFNDNLDLSLTAAVHWKPRDGLRIGASYYYDFLDNNVAGAHSGHGGPRPHYNGPLYKGTVNYHLFSFSYADFNDKYELLNEFTYNIAATDTLGSANNFANFLYVGYKITPTKIPYVFLDYMNISKRDLHTYPFINNKIGIGFKKEFTPLVCLKSQLEYNISKSPGTHDHSISQYGLRIQLSYGF